MAFAKRKSLPDETSVDDVGQAADLTVSKATGVKVWFDDICTVKKTGFTAVMKTVKPKAMVILPWKICWLPNEFPDQLSKIRAALAEEEKTVEITSELKVTQVKKEVTLELPAHNSKPMKETFIFEAEATAAQFVQTIREEVQRTYIQSDNFSPSYCKELNADINKRILAGDKALREVYLASFNMVSPRAAIEALFTNYRTMTDFELSDASAFAQLLSAVAQDPVVFILFLCCTILLDEQAGAYLSDKTNGGRPLHSHSELYNALFRHIVSTVSAPEWKIKRELLLSQFQYPVTATTGGSSGLVTPAVAAWTAHFTDNYRKLEMDIRMLDRLLLDERYLCYLFMHHHTTLGNVRLVTEAFSAVNQEYLFSKFDINLNGDAGAGADYDAHDRENRRQITDRHHFVDFLFHRNLSARPMFLSLLEAFKRGNGYDDKFFHMFLTEAIQMDKPRVAVDAINTILFLENGEPSVAALRHCPKIPMILFETLQAGVAAGQRLSDDLRLLLEISLGFEYFALRTELMYLKTLSMTFARAPEGKSKFNDLLKSMEFVSFAVQLCNHNLTLRDAAGVNGVNAAAAAAANGASATSGRLPRVGSSEARRGSNWENHSEFDDQTITTYSGDEDLRDPLSGNDHGGGGGGGGSGRSGAWGRAASTTTSELRYTNNSQPANKAVLAGRRGSLQFTTTAENHFRHRDRSDSNLIAVVYGLLTLVVRCGPLPSPDRAEIVENAMFLQFLTAVHPAFYRVLLCAGTHLRVRLTDFLKSQFQFVELYKNLLGDASILSQPEHFQFTFLHALSYHAKFLTHLMELLVVTALYLQEYTNLYATLQMIDESIGRFQEQQGQLEMVLTLTLQRDRDELCASRIVLSDLADFARTIAAALASVRGNSQREGVVVCNAKQLLAREPVHFWREGFQQFALLDHSTAPAAPTFVGPPPRPRLSPTATTSTTATGAAVAESNAAPAPAAPVRMSTVEPEPAQVAEAAHNDADVGEVEPSVQEESGAVVCKVERADAEAHVGAGEQSYSVAEPSNNEEVVVEAAVEPEPEPACAGADASVHVEPQQDEAAEEPTVQNGAGSGEQEGAVSEREDEGDYHSTSSHQPGSEPAEPAPAAAAEGEDHGPDTAAAEAREVEPSAPAATATAASTAAASPSVFDRFRFWRKNSEGIERVSEEPTTAQQSEVEPAAADEQPAEVQEPAVNASESERDAELTAAAAAAAYAALEGQEEGVYSQEDYDAIHDPVEVVVE